MHELNKYIQTHTQVASDTTVAGRLADMVFFRLEVVGEPSVEKLQALLTAHNLVAGPLNPFDGREHSYLELGAWLESQELALRLMGLGAVLGMWQLLTPYTLFGNRVSQEVAQNLAGQGLVTIVRMPTPAVTA